MNCLERVILSFIRCYDTTCHQRVSTSLAYPQQWPNMGHIDMRQLQTEENK